MPRQGSGRKLRKEIAIASSTEQLEMQEREQGKLVDHTPEYEYIGRSKDPQLIIRGVRSWGISHDTKQRVLKKLDDVTRGEMDAKMAINIAKVLIAIDGNEIKKATVMFGAERVGLGPQVKEASDTATVETEMSGEEMFLKMVERCKTLEEIMVVKRLAASIEN